MNGSETTKFVGAHYETVHTDTGTQVTKYYFAGSQRIAMRKNNEVFYMLGDHLGSTSLTTDAAGQVIAEQRYTAWGETRYDSGESQTKYQYTGQYSYVSDFGLHFYNARWYDSTIGRFTSADTIIPEQSQGVQAWDRYAYTNNNPVKYVDPNGHDGVPWSFTFNSATAISTVNAIGNFFGVSDLNQTIASVYDAGSAMLDGAALALDTGIVALEVTGAIIGSVAGVALCPLCTPITGPAGAALGYGMVDLGTRPLLYAANILSLTSTALTATSDLLSGESSLEITLHGDGTEMYPTNAYVDVSGFIGQDTYISAGLTAAGFLAPNALASTPIQAASTANSLGLFRKGPEIMKLGDNISRYDKYVGNGVKNIGMGLSLLPPSLPFSRKNLPIWE